MSCHLDVFLMMEHAAFVYDPKRGLLRESSACKLTKALVCLFMALSLPNKNDLRDAFWAKYMTHAHSDAVGSMGDVEAHVRTFAGVFTGSKALSQQLKEYYTFDRWITYNMREECTVATCQYSRVHKVMSHALILPEFITTTNGSTKREFSIAHGVIRALLQSSGVRQQCPTCKDYHSILRTKQVNTISLPRRLVVGLDSAGNLCLEDPPDVLNIYT